LSSESISEIRDAFAIPDLPYLISKTGISYLRFKDPKCVCDFEFARPEIQDSNLSFSDAASSSKSDVRERERERERTSGNIKLNK